MRPSLEKIQLLVCHWFCLTNRGILTGNVIDLDDVVTLPYLLLLKARGGRSKTLMAFAPPPLEVYSLARFLVEH